MTKMQVRAESRYRKQLKLCGFRSWKAANNRRCDLINAGSECDELAALQHLADLYLDWKHSTTNLKRRLNRMLKKYQTKETT